MLTKEQLSTDLKGAMKSAGSATVGVLRMLISVINNKEIEKRGKTGAGELTAEELLAVLLSEEKKRQEAATIFIKGGRQDLADKEAAELTIIQRYLPKRMTTEETEAAVDKIIANLKASGADVSFGVAMKEITKELKGKADAKLISELVKKKIGQ